MVNLPPDLVAKILSVEWGISVRATINTFLEIPLLTRIRSPSRMVARVSLLFFGGMAQNYHLLIKVANIFIRASYGHSRETCSMLRHTSGRQGRKAEQGMTHLPAPVTGSNLDNTLPLR